MLTNHNPEFWAWNPLLKKRKKTAAIEALIQIWIVAQRRRFLQISSMPISLPPGVTSHGQNNPTWSLGGREECCDRSITTSEAPSDWWKWGAGNFTISPFTSLGSGTSGIYGSLDPVGIFCFLPPVVAFHPLTLQCPHHLWHYYPQVKGSASHTIYHEATSLGHITAFPIGAGLNCSKLRHKRLLENCQRQPPQRQISPCCNAS